MINTLDHVQLAMPPGREDDARFYYSGLLGLTETEKPPELRARGGVWFTLQDGRQVHLGVEADFRSSKKAHPCFVTKVYDELTDRLLAAGYQVQHDTLNPPARRCYTYDIFGNRLEFADRISSGVTH